MLRMAPFGMPPLSQSDTPSGTASLEPSSSSSM